MRRTPEEIKTCVEDLLSRMTLEEKIGQMVQSAGADTTAIGGEVKTSPLEGLIAEGKIGSIIYMPDSAAMARRLQRIAVEKSRLGIPLIFCQDVIHGFQTIFPIPLGWSCSFDPDLVRRATEISAREATRAGVMLAFAPMLDIARDPRWGRISEGAGEDPFLDACMARAEVLGYQGGEGGQGLGDGEHMACCLKHFVGYGAAEAGRDYNTVEISPSTLHNVYLPAFQAGVDAGAATVMPSFNLVDGVSSAASPYVLQELLRKELGFDGVIISDYAAVFEVIAHGLAADEREAAERCANAGLDVEMATDLFNRELPQLVMEGKVPESLVDDAVRRILTLKYRLGIMDDPYLYMHEGEEEAAYLAPAHLEVARRLAQESAVLLKNDGALPLRKGAKIALVGPCADSQDQLGPWQFSKRADRTVTLRQGLEEKGFTVLCEPATTIHEELVGGINRAVKLARECDVVVLAVGEDMTMSGEAACRQEICVLAIQMELARAVAAAGKPVVAVVTCGRPLLLDWFDKNASAVLCAWFAGTEAGHALADLLAGDANPSGKLSVTFPRSMGQIPIYYNHMNTGRPWNGVSDEKFVSRYLDGPNTPLYPFGHGLSYSSFRIKEAALSSGEMAADGALTVRVRVQNDSGVAGTAVLQMYLHDVSARIARPVKELKGFARVDLAPGEEKEVCLPITPDLLRFHDGREWLLEPGRFVVMLGFSSADDQLEKLEFSLV